MRIFLALAFSLAATSLAAAFETPAPYALLIDESSGKVLFEKNADKPMAPASTTKILTAEVIFSMLASGKLTLDQSFVVSPHAATEGNAESGGSSMLTKAGDRIKIGELLQGLLVDSGNDAAITLAEGVAKSESGFAAIMNAHARAIGMTHSHFTNPWGHAGNRVTCRDMVKLAAHVIATYPQYYKYFGMPSFSWRGVEQQNRNPLLADGADGLKTGHLMLSGFGLVGSGVFGGHRLILVMNGLKSEEARADEGKRLLDYGKSEVGG
jgi:D-alanyl-D-alanine carboxypeptidase (penicillin-binding protein 5/6)